MTISKNGGNCRKCGEELLDSSRQVVKDLIASTEERLQHRRVTQARWLAVPITFVVFVAAYMAWARISWWDDSTGALEVALSVSLLVGVLIAAKCPKWIPGRKFRSVHEQR